MAEFNVIGEVDSGLMALDRVQRYKPHLVLMDLKLSDVDGLEIIPRIKRSSPKTNIVVFTAYQDDEHILQALEAGATSYLLKDVHSDQLVEALLHTIQGEAVLHPKIATRVLNILVEPAGNGHKGTANLTKREIQVLKLVANGKNNQEIAEELVISISTAKAHVSNILSKLHLADRTQAAAYAWQTGLMQRQR
jgi:DNA-binding NarL/FixJ family response regulator